MRTEFLCMPAPKAAIESRLPGYQKSHHGAYAREHKGQWVIALDVEGSEQPVAVTDLEEHRAAPAKKPLPKIRLASIRADIRHAILPPPDYIWAPRIPRDGVTLLVGEDGLGKSWVALMIAMYCAAGKRLFDADVAQGPTCYVHAEDRLPMLERRIQRIVQDFTAEEEKRYLANFQHYDVAGDDVLLLTCKDRTPQRTPWVDAFKQQLGKRVLTVFDPLARLHDGAENDSTVMTRCLKMLEVIGGATGGAILAPHHPNKSGTQQHRTDGTDSRGSGAIRAASRSQLRLIAANRKQDVPGATNISDDDLAQQNVLILSQPKLSDGAKARPLILKRATDGTLAPFHVECGDPLQGLVTWFKGPQQSKPFTATRARNQRGQWGAMAEHGAEQFIAEQVESGALIPAGGVKGKPAYVPSPATLGIINDPEGWDNIEMRAQAPGTQKLGPRESIMMDLLKTMAPSGTVAQEDLIEGYKTRVPKGDGRDQRRTYASTALIGLIAKKMAYMHGEDHVSLTPLISTTGDV